MSNSTGNPSAKMTWRLPRGPDPHERRPQPLRPDHLDELPIRIDRSAFNKLDIVIPRAAENAAQQTIAAFGGAVEDFTS